MNWNFLNQMGNQAALVGALAVLTFVMSLLLSYSIVRDFNKPDVLPQNGEESQFNRRN
jgi:hypothetical protein